MNVDEKAASRMSIRDTDQTELSESVDSSKIVRNLAASQKCEKYTLFLSFTENQSKHPERHECDDRCMVRRSNGSRRIRILNYFKLNLDISFKSHLGIARENQVDLPLLFIKHLWKHSLCEKIPLLFTRKECQSLGNVSHVHVMMNNDGESTLVKNSVNHTYQEK